MHTDYHTLPIINGFSQKEGEEFKATNVSCNAKKSTFTLDIAKAYPDEAGIESFIREYILKGRTLTITDNFQLKNAEIPNKQIFMTYGMPKQTGNDKFYVNADGKIMEGVHPKGWTMENGRASVRERV